uniref:HMG box domain-containing protein n=1 Tax=Felis catus TaxID=9685 RepID=A0ABI7ZJ96_FELCA
MGKGDPKKPRGKMSSYHKKKHPDASVNFSEFSKKCSERWKTMSAKEKGKFEDMAKADKARYEREMKTYIPPKGETKKKFKDPNAPKRPPSAFFLFCSEYRPKIKGEHPGLSIGDVAKKLGEMWNNTAADDKHPYEKKAAKLKEKYEKDIRPTSTQVMISQFVSLNPQSGSVLTAWSLLRILCLPLSLPFPCSRSVSLSLKNKH